jgi:hypothetical protein
MAVNDNTINMSEHRGEVEPCKFCRKEETLLGRACGWCFGSGYTAKCLNCDGTGLETAGSVWDGGKSKHSSTCNICGGKGMLPARKADYKGEVDGSEDVADDKPLADASAQPMKNLAVTRSHAG